MQETFQRQVAKNGYSLIPPPWAVSCLCHVSTLIYLAYCEIQCVLHVDLVALNDPPTIWDKTCVHKSIVFDKSSTSYLHGVYHNEEILLFNCMRKWVCGIKVNPVSKHLHMFVETV